MMKSTHNRATERVNESPSHSHSMPPLVIFFLAKPKGYYQHHHQPQITKTIFDTNNDDQKGTQEKKRVQGRFDLRYIQTTFRSAYSLMCCARTEYGHGNVFPLQSAALYRYLVRCSVLYVLQHIIHVNTKPQCTVHSTVVLRGLSVHNRTTNGCYDHCSPQLPALTWL